MRSVSESYTEYDHKKMGGGGYIYITINKYMNDNYSLDSSLILRGAK